MNRNWAILRRNYFSDDKLHTSKIGCKLVHPLCRIIRHFDEKYLSLNFFLLAKLAFSAFPFCVSLPTPQYTASQSYLNQSKPNLGKAVLTLCQHRHLICQIQKTDMTRSNFRGKKVQLDQFPRARGNTAEKKAICGQRGCGAEQNYPILATAVSTHTIIPYLSRFGYLCMGTG